MNTVRFVAHTVLPRLCSGIQQAARSNDTSTPKIVAPVNGRLWTVCSGVFVNTAMNHRQQFPI